MGLCCIDLSLETVTHLWRILSRYAGYISFIIVHVNRDVSMNPIDCGRRFSENACNGKISKQFVPVQVQ